MKATCPLSVTACLVFHLGCSIANAQSDGMAYRWRAPGAYFGDPTPISDRDEASTSQSSFRIGLTAEPITDVRSRDILVGTYSVVPNPALGYAYAGFAVPFITPMALDEEAAFQFEARSAEGIERLELILRDTSRRRATHVVTVAPSTDWTTITVPASQLTAIDMQSIESAAMVVLSPGSGRLEISNMLLPIRTPEMERSILDEVRTAPKWHVDAAMAMLVTRNLQKPILVLVDASEVPSREVLAGEAWNGILSRTVNLRITDPEGISMGEHVSDQQITDSHCFLFAPNGVLLSHGPADKVMESGLSDVLAQWEEGRSQ